MGKIADFLKANTIDRNLVYRILIAVMSLIIFYIILSLIQYVSLSRWISFLLMKEYFVIALLGAAPIVFGKYHFSSVFFAGATIGWGVACYVAFLQGPHPTMIGAFYNMVILFTGFIIGLIAQIRHNVRKANPDLFKKSK